MSKKKTSNILDSICSGAKDLYNTGVINDVTMREFESLCLDPPKKFDSKRIKKLRKKEHFSQAVFAKFLNVSTSTVKQWENGDKEPNGATARLLEIVERHGANIILNEKHVN